MLLAAGRIAGLKVHPHYDLRGINGGKIGRGYTADFAYDELGADGQTLAHVVEDVKSGRSAKDPVYRLRIKIFIENYPDLEFREVKG
jgi:hypothetical protein